ncbi:ELM1/GtrOC1 family putative glycosyltransferase [Variovorax sp. RHLX14]|uniref:ELM1/GtrOC1 family putative glycosyltransferase n=1 Tax=Variovorax sp. RHLX14 TaxID=1259731 RepID=UPI003F474F78
MKSIDGAAPLWVLLGTRHGDNQQLLAIVDALGIPYRSVPLRFNAAAGLPPALLGASRLAWKTKEDLQLVPPWPRAVLAAGRKSVSAALWIGKQSGGQTRLIHVNRPWAPLSWFDLVVTTPQYAVPPRANVLINRMPFLLPSTLDEVALPADLHARSDAMPRPWTLAMVGGDSRPFVLDDAAAARFAEKINAEVRTHGGSAWVLGSPRTPASAMAIIERALEVPSHVVRWGQGENPYAALRRTADRFVVTTDSASMVTEALLSGKPVVPFDLPVQPDWRWRVATAWRKAAVRAPQSIVGRSFEWLQDLGLLSSVRDLDLMRRSLEEAGAFDGTGIAPELARQEREITLARIAALIEKPR